jgi:hypothetical protein
MITSHLNTYLNEKNIPFMSIPKIGISIERKYYSYDNFKNFDCYFLDSTFIINYKN